MTDQMTRLQQEAEKRYPYPASGASNFMDKADESEWKQSAFMSGRTISREQFNRAAWAVRGSSESTLEQIQSDLRIALEAAGMVIEE